MKNEIYLVIEYNGFISNPKEHIVGAFTKKEDADHQAKLINEWNAKDCCELSAKVEVASLDKFYT